MTISDARGLLPGDVGFSVIPGRVGRGIDWGQTWLRPPCRYSHAFLVVDGGQCVEAMPSGARLAPVASRVSGRNPSGFTYARLPLTKQQRTDVAKIGRDLVGTPYSFADYAALALPRWEWLRGYVSSSGHMICSQLVDYALCRVGYHLFDDGRWSQDVTPGALFYATERLGWTL